MSPDLVVVDHRPASLGEIHGARAWIESHRAFVDLIPDLRLRVVAIHSIGANGAVGRLRAVGTNAEGGTVEQTMEQTGLLENGAIARLEIFPVGAHGAAIARFEELRRSK